MAFDIHQIDDLDDYDEEAIYEYQDELHQLFLNSPEGQTFAQTHPDMGFWSLRLIDYGRTYTSHLTEMDEGDMEELLTEVFPRKISLSAPEDADDGIPELIAFWEYLKREYQLPNADSILNYLRSVKVEEFRDWMNDPSRFGMAKSFFMQGQSAGFDMNNEQERNLFMASYNASLPHPDSVAPPPLMELLAAGLEAGLGGSGRVKKDHAKAKHKRKIARASRKKNRKRR